MAERWREVFEEKPSRKTREAPAPDWVFDQHTDTHKPSSELEALMMATPGEEGDWVADQDRGDTYSNLEALLGVDLDLSELEMDVLDAVFVAGLSIREAADQLDLPPTTVWRIKESALNRIRKRVGE